MARIYHTWHGFYPVTFVNTNSIFFPATTDYAISSPNNSYNFGNGTTDSPFSVALWFNVTNLLTTGGGLICKGDSVLNTYEWDLDIQLGGNVRIILRDAGIAPRIIRFSNQILTSATWTHVVATYDGSSNASGLNIYINGSIENASALTVGSYVSMHNLGGELKVGAQPNSSAFGGKIDNIGIFNKELSPAEVLECYNGGTAVNYASTSMAANLYDNFEFENNATSGVLGNTLTLQGTTTYSTDVP